MTLGELFIKIGFKPDVEQLKGAQAVVQKSANALQAKAGVFKAAGNNISNGFKSMGNGIKGFFSSINVGANKLGDFIANIKAIHIQIVALATAMVMITKKASDYAAELLRVNSVTGISTQALQALQQQAALSGIEADELNGALKGLQRSAQEVAMGRGNIHAWAMLGIRPDEDPIKVLSALQAKLKTMSAARGAMFAEELGLSDKMISFLKEAGSLGASDRSLLLSDKEIKKLKEFNIFFNRTWDNSKRLLQRIGVALIPITTLVVGGFQKMAQAGKDLSKFFEWFSMNFKGITKALLLFAGIIGIALFPMTAAFILLAAAIEDVVGWANGKKSLTGALIGPFKEWKGVIDEIINGLKIINAVLEAIFTSKGRENLGKDFKEKWEQFQKGPTGPALPPKTAEEMGGWTQIIKDIFKEGTSGKYSYGGNTTINVNGAGDPAEVAKKTYELFNSNTMFQQGPQQK